MCRILVFAYNLQYMHYSTFEFSSNLEKFGSLRHKVEIMYDHCVPKLAVTGLVCSYCMDKKKTRMWANAQRDGRPAEYRWRPLFNAAKFG